MAIQCKNDFSKGMVLDLDKLRLPENTAIWIKDMTTGVNINANAPALSGASALVRTPTEGNTALTPGAYPSGTNYCIGTYSSEQTNELYYFLFNSNNNHSVWVINGDTGVISKVYQNALLGFVLDPQYFISQGRCTMAMRSIIDPVTGNETNYKFLIFAYNLNNQFCIEVSSSIATSSFSTSYFTASAAFYNPLELVHHGVATPLQAIGLNTPTAYVPVSSDLTEQNLLVRNGWQFRVKFVDIFGRESEHGIISSQYITIIGGGCITASNSLPRCMMLNFDAGNPLVNQIQIEYRQWVGNDTGSALATGWLIYEIINKYDNSLSVEWYNRPYNPLFTSSGSGVTFNAGTNIIAYTFCADKNSIPIDPAETSRTEPELPRISESAFFLDTRVGFANNVRGFQPIPQSEVEKVVFSPKLPSSSPCPAAPLRTITLYANIYRPRNNTSAIIRTSLSKVVFGDNDGPCSVSAPTSYSMDQVFADQSNPGFIAYLAGTPYACVAQQGNYNLSTNTFTYEGYGSGIAFADQPMQQIVIKDVPAGKYIVRIASHHSKITDPNYQKTSTTVAGICNLSEAYGGDRHNYAANPIKEIEVDCTTGNVNLQNAGDPMFVIIDLTDSNSAVDFYLIEALGGNTPVEMNPVNFSSQSAFGTGQDCYGSFFTDHNGYGFACGKTNTYVNIGFDNCIGGFAGYLSYYKTQYGIQHGDGTGSPTGACSVCLGNPFNQVYLYATTFGFPSGARRQITQNIFTCADHTVGVPGVPVVMTKGAAGITNTGGSVTLIAHNRYNYAACYGATGLPYLASLLPDYSISPNNQDELVFSQKGGCEWTDCGGCNSYRADVTVTYVACGGSRNTTEPDIYVNTSGTNIYGVQSGGKYPVAIWGHDIIGRHSAPQSRAGANSFVTIPNLNDVGYQQFALSQIQVNIDSSFAIDPIFTKLTFLVGANVLFTDYFSWAADWVQPVDNTGATNAVNPTFIRIYYGSLNEYNKQYNFSTNTGWEFISTGTNNQSSPIEGDIVQFIMNGDGSWLDSVISAPISYDSSGLFFTFNYLPELAGLINGALFRVIRPAQNTSGELVPLYEQSLTVPLVNGIPQSFSFTLPYFDSYLLQRLIPTPLLYGQTGPIAPGATPSAAVTPTGVTPALTGTVQYTSSNNTTSLDQGGYATNNINNSNSVVRFQLIDYPTSFPFYFEGPSPSDFWGSHIACRGRVGVPNPYAMQQRIDTEVALSDTAGSRGSFNGISYFESINVEVFDRNTWGGITAVLVETSVMLVICDKDHFITRFNGSTLQVNSQNQVITQNQNGIFMAPERKAGSNYGCDLASINTIVRYAGIVHWLDTSGYMVAHNFSAAQSQTDSNGYQGYLLNKIATVKIRNQNQSLYGLSYPVSGIDPKTNEVVLTWFNIPNSGTPNYLNTLDQPSLNANETLVFELGSAMLKNFASFTYEGYAPFPSYYLQKNFISFKQGIPYIHHANLNSAIPAPPYANYHGVQCLPRVTFVTNKEPERSKRFFWIEVYCRTTIQLAPAALNTALFLADIIVTEKGQQSRLFTSQWVMRDGYATACFLCDLDTPPDPNIPLQTGPNVILDGNPLQGRWIEASLVVQSVYTGVYFELSSASVYVNGIQKPEGK